MQFQAILQRHTKDTEFMEHERSIVVLFSLFSESNLTDWWHCNDCKKNKS